MQEKAIEKLQSAIGTSYLELKECLREDTIGQNHEWLEIKALRCEEQLREVLDFIRGFGSGNTLHEGIAVAAPEDVLELFHCIDSDFREQQARIRELVVYEKVPVNCRHPVSGDGPLDFAVLRRRPASARTLLALGATLASCSSQVTDLYEAALSGGLEDIVQLCLRWGSSYEAHVALFAAAQLGDAERCRQLLAIKADPARREQVTGFSVLEWAVLAPVSADVVVSLLPYADAVAIQSTLRLSAIYGRSTVLYHLMSADCDVCRRDADGWTAFDWAISQGHEDFALQLLQQGPQIAYASGRPLASLARVSRHNGLIHLAELLEAEPVAKAEAAFEQILRGGTATELQELLLQGRFRLNSPLQVSDFAGSWPLQCCLELSRPDLALQLLRWQAHPDTAAGNVSTP